MTAPLTAAMHMTAVSVTAHALPPFPVFQTAAGRTTADIAESIVRPGVGQRKGCPAPGLGLLRDLRTKAHAPIQSEVP